MEKAEETAYWECSPRGIFFQVLLGKIEQYGPLRAIEACLDGGKCGWD